MHRPTDSSASPERRLDRTWRWVDAGANVDSKPALTAQIGTVRVSRVVVVGAEVVMNASEAVPADSNPTRARVAPGAHDCVYVPDGLAAETDDWCTVSSLALARTLPALPKVCATPKEQTHRGRILQSR